MECFEVIALPTDETLTYLSTVFSGCPFDLDMKRMHVSLNISQDEMETQPENLYMALAGNMGVWYDTGTKMSSLILPLVSPTLNDRVAELREEAPNVFYGEHYFPHMIVVQDMPPMARHYSNFIASVAHILATLENAPLFFNAELQIEREFQAIPQADFYSSMLANHYRR